MAEYIDREAARLAVEQQCVDGKMLGNDESDSTLIDAYDVIDAIHDILAADVAPVVHGKWERVSNPNWPAHIHDKCSVCGWWNTRNALCYDGRKGHCLNYCPQLRSQDGWRG